jgi:hypothetical protein
MSVLRYQKGENEIRFFKILASSFIKIKITILMQIMFQIHLFNNEYETNIFYKSKIKHTNYSKHISYSKKNADFKSNDIMKSACKKSKLTHLKILIFLKK